MIEEIINLAQLNDKAKEYLTLFPEYRLFCIEGNLGAGKTTLIQAFCRALGVIQAVQSPSFGLLHSYHAPNKIIYHADLYRLKHIEELYDIGILDILDSQYYCFIEWPKLLIEHFDINGLLITLNYHDENSRQIEIKEID